MKARSYRLFTPDVTANPVKIRRQMEKYRIAGKYSAATLMSDGGYKPIGGWVPPLFTGIGLGAAGLMGGPFAVAPLVGAAIDIMRAGGKKGEGEESVPVGVFLEVTFTNVGPDRALWAEYTLCAVAASEGWNLESALLDERNANAKPVPRAWADKKDSGNRGRRRAKKKSADDSAGSKFAKWFLG